MFGHFARDCKTSLNINNMSYDALEKHFKEIFMEKSTKDQEKKSQDF